ncbi:MAG: hypothetical protein QW735_01010 [archaeon]
MDVELFKKVFTFFAIFTLILACIVYLIKGISIAPLLGILTPGILGSIFIYRAILFWKIKKEVEELPTSKIADLSAAKGKLVEIHGTIAPADKVVKGVFVDKDCVYDRRSVSITLGHGKHADKRLSIEEEKAQAFYVVDESGSILVELKKAHPVPKTFLYNYSSPIWIIQKLTKEETEIPQYILEPILNGKIKFLELPGSLFRPAKPGSIDIKKITSLEVDEGYLPVGEEVWVIGIVKDNEYTNEEWAKRGTNPELMIGEGKEVFGIVWSQTGLEKEIMRKLNISMWIFMLVGIVCVTATLILIYFVLQSGKLI